MSGRTLTQQDSEKSKDVRKTNITAARAVADVVRTSLGPRGMDKMVSFNPLFLSTILNRSKIPKAEC